MNLNSIYDKIVLYQYVPIRYGNWIPVNKINALLTSTVLVLFTGK